MPSRNEITPVVTVQIAFGSKPENRSADGITVNLKTRRAVFDMVAERWQAGQGFTLATVNLDHMVKLQRDPAFRHAYGAHSHVVADGNPIVWLSRLAGQPVDLIPGSELIKPLVALATKHNIPVAIFGAQQEILDRVCTKLKKDYPGLRVTAQIAPPQDFDPNSPEADAFITALALASTRLCLVALGAPKQEVFAIRASEIMPECGFVSIGAGIDFIVGSQKRAPYWVRRIAMEWLWRLLHNPARLAGRYWRCAVLLPALALAAMRQRTP